MEREGEAGRDPREVIETQRNNSSFRFSLCHFFLIIRIQALQKLFQVGFQHFEKSLRELMALGDFWTFEEAYSLTEEVVDHAFSGWLGQDCLQMESIWV